MARLIQKSGYIQGGRAARYMEYVAKRDGVEVLQSTEPVTKKQMQFLTKLLKDFPDAKELFEYADYLQTPNRGTASAFIVAALDTHLHELESESGYMAYIANRPRAEKRGGHGLFSAEDVTDLIPANAVMRLLHHMGQIFRTSMPVIPPALRIDSKRRRRLQEKRMAMGHKRNDHEDEQLHHVNDNTMR